MNAKSQKEAQQEVVLLKSVQHKNIIRYYGSFFERGALYIIMEYAEGGDLQQLLRRHRSVRKHFAEETLWRFCTEMCSALACLHSKGIVHRDLKPLNVFLTTNNHIKVGDLGVSKLCPDDDGCHTRVGTPLYLAPEQVKHKRYDAKVDVWALGVLLYTLTSFEAPFRGDNLIALGMAITQRRHKPLPKSYSETWRELIDGLLAKNPAQRPSLDAVLQTIPQQFKAHLRPRSATPTVARVAKASNENKDKETAQTKRELPSNTPRLLSAARGSGVWAARRAQPDRDANIREDRDTTQSACTVRDLKDTLDTAEQLELPTASPPREKRVLPVDAQFPLDASERVEYQRPIRAIARPGVLRPHSAVAGSSNRRMNLDPIADPQPPLIGSRPSSASTVRAPWAAAAPPRIEPLRQSVSKLARPSIMDLY
jgi:NIMA (never in mitosis gene a)-related kinase